MTTMLTVLALSGCGSDEVSEEVPTAGLHQRIECGPAGATPTDPPRLVTACLDDRCEGLEVTLEPSVGPATWSLDGQVVADGACGVEVWMTPSREAHTLTAKWGAGEVATQQMKAMVGHGDPLDGEPLPEVVIYGNGEGCDLFWITALAGCLYTREMIFEQRLFALSNLTGPPDQVGEFSFYPQPAPATPGVNEYASWASWTVDSSGQFPAGPLPSVPAAGSDPHLTHGFALVDGQRAQIFQRHRATDWEFVDTFWCIGDRGGVGDLPPPD